MINRKKTNSNTTLHVLHALNPTPSTPIISWTNLFRLMVLVNLAINAYAEKTSNLFFETDTKINPSLPETRFKFVTRMGISTAQGGAADHSELYKRVLKFVADGACDLALEVKNKPDK